MKLLTAIVPPNRVARVTAALEGAGMTATTLATGQASGMGSGQRLQYKGVAYTDRRCVRLEVLVDDDDLEVAFALVSPPAETANEAVIVWATHVEGPATSALFASSRAFAHQT